MLPKGMCWFISEVEKKELYRQIKWKIKQSCRVKEVAGVQGGGGTKIMNINRSRVNIEHNIVIYLLSTSK